ncbi:MAG: hypothetical protein VX262_03370 [Acidobacteriota bacterium]|nr:hypothetical protein [Acidobacteriota bacterium]
MKKKDALHGGNAACRRSIKIGVLSTDQTQARELIRKRSAKTSNQKTQNTIFVFEGL